jgi:hypothetical protein
MSNTEQTSDFILGKFWRILSVCSCSPSKEVHESLVVRFPSSHFGTAKTGNEDQQQEDLSCERQGAVDSGSRYSCVSAKLEEQATDLERIRNNQRRCRARQKEYIATLENKIRQYEGMNIESTNKQKLEDFATENRSLKRLLQFLGLRNEFLDAYSNAVRIAPDISRPLLADDRFAVSQDCPALNPPLDTLEVCRSNIICTLHQI